MTSGSSPLCLSSSIVDIIQSHFVTINLKNSAALMDQISLPSLKNDHVIILFSPSLDFLLKLFFPFFFFFFFFGKFFRMNDIIKYVNVPICVVFFMSYQASSGILEVVETFVARHSLPFYG